MIPSTPSLLEATDLTWVTDIVDTVAASRGQPWRIALERVDAIQQHLIPTGPEQWPPPKVSAKKFTAVVGAVQRVIGGRTKNVHLARTCRSLVLGRPALSPDDREDRIAAAARALDISCLAVELALWADLPRERPVDLPHGRPNELEVAAFANVHLIQSAVRRAQRLTIDVVGDASALLRGAAARGLLVTASIQPRNDLDADLAQTPDATSAASAALVRVEIEGPIALCHRTAVYGRALASLVPLLAECDQWTMTLTSSGLAGDYSTQFSSPALLPVVPSSLSGPPYIVARLARELRIALAAEATSTRRPGPPAVVIRRNGAVVIAAKGSSSAPATTQSAVTDPAAGEMPSEMRATRDRVVVNATPGEIRVTRDGVVVGATPGEMRATHDRVVVGATPEERVVVAGPPIVEGGAYLCPDLVVGGTCIEVVGFWTRDHLERKVAAYAAAGRRVVLCVDELRGCGDDDLPSSVIGFTRHIDVDAVLRKLRGR